MTDRTQRLAAAAGVLFLCGGFAGVGAAAGLRMAIGLTTQTADCSEFACVPVVRAFNNQAELLLLAGGVALACGLVLLAWTRHYAQIGADDARQ